MYRVDPRRSSPDLASELWWWSGAGSNRRPSAFQASQIAMSWCVASAWTVAEVCLWSRLAGIVAVTVAVRA
jgi:hypothetical protein